MEWIVVGRRRESVENIVCVFPGGGVVPLGKVEVYRLVSWGCARGQWSGVWSGVVLVGEIPV